MSDLEVVVLVAVAGWMAGLSIMVAATVRQVGLLMLSVRQMSEIPSAPDGLDVGVEVPESVSRSVPDLDGGITYILLMEAGCEPCRSLAGELYSARLDFRGIAVIRGDQERADTIAELLPGDLAVVLDPVASEIADAMGSPITPLVFEVDRGFVSGKAVPRTAADLKALIDARAGSGAEDPGSAASELRAGLTIVSGEPQEAQP